MPHIRKDHCQFRYAYINDSVQLKHQLSETNSIEKRVLVECISQYCYLFSSKEKLFDSLYSFYWNLFRANSLWLIKKIVFLFARTFFKGKKLRKTKKKILMQNLKQKNNIWRFRIGNKYLQFKTTLCNPSGKLRTTVDSLYLEHPLSGTSLYLELKSQSLGHLCML